MQNLQFYKEQELKKLDKVIAQAGQVLKRSPEGNLRIIHNHNTVQYYWRSSVNSTNKATGKYIRKAEKQLAVQLAQKEYAISMLKVAKQKKLQLQKETSDYNWEKIVNVHKNLPVEKQKLITPFVLSDDEYALQWEEEIKKNAYIIPTNEVCRYPLDEDSGQETERGELVRSKSEKIIADKLHMMKIPYQYEIPLYLKEVGYIYPDFTLLNKRTRQVFYWEHFGMMDNPEYSEKAIRKISSYGRNGILQGKTLITTYETDNQTLDFRMVGSLISEFLL